MFPLKLEVSTAVLFRENRSEAREGQTDGRTDRTTNRRTDGRGATLNAVPQEGRVIT